AFTLRPRFPNAQGAIDAEFDTRTAVDRFDVNIVGADFDGLFQHVHNLTANGVFVELAAYRLPVGEQIHAADDVRRDVARLANFVALALCHLRHGRDER